MRPALLLGAILTILSACSKPPTTPAERPPVNVSVINVVPRSVPVSFEYVGQTESSQQVEIRARVSGFLEQRVYEEGSFVKAGQTLFVIDKKPFQASLAAAKAELSQQQARLTVARQNLARVKPLAAQNALSQKDLDDAIGQEQSAAAAVEAAKANVTDAELNLSYCTITSPVAGLSSFAKQQNGSYISPQTSLLTYVAKLDPMRVNFSLSENEILNLHTSVKDGQLKVPLRSDLQVEIILADGTINPSRGHITFTDASFNQETGTYLIRADFANPKGTLRPGQFVRVKVLGAERPNSFVVPQRAVQQGPRGEYVWVITPDNKAEQRAVTMGQWLGSQWLISDGLRANDKVVVDGALLLAPGAAVKATVLTDAQVKAEIAGSAPVASPASSDTSHSAPVATTASPATEQSGAVKTPEASTTTSGQAATVKVYFASSSTVPSAASAQSLAKVAAQLAASPQSKVALTGYTDKRGNAAKNLELAKMRAQAVRNALYVAGVQANQIDMRPPVSVTGHQNDEEARRVDVSVIAQ